MMREIGAARTVLQREQPVDWSTESLARFRRCDTSVADEVVDREADVELVELTAKVLDELTERQRAVAVLYSHGLQRKEIAAHLDVSPRVVKRSLEQLLSTGRRRLIRLGDPCTTSETAGNDIGRLPVQVPGAGTWTVLMWRKDAAGNADPATASDPVTLRYDPEPPQLAFDAPSSSDPTLVSVPVTDKVSGLADGSIEISPAGSNT
jgi:hypothetical protein